MLDHWSARATGPWYEQGDKMNGRAALLASFREPILWVGLLFAALLLRMEALRPVFRWAFPGVEPVIYQRSSFLALFLSHLALVAAASLAAISVGLSLAVFVTRPVGRDFRLMVNTLATVGQTFPPAAVLAIAVPAVGFGSRPTVMALFLYGLLPIVASAIAGSGRSASRGARSSRRARPFVLAAAARCGVASGCSGHPFWNTRLGDDRHRHGDDRINGRRLDARHSDI